MRKYVRLYFTDADRYEDLSDDQLGRMIRAGIRYADTGESPDFSDDKFLNYAWKDFKVNIDIDCDSYNKRIQSSSKGGTIRYVREKLNLDDSQINELKRMCSAKNIVFEHYLKDLSNTLSNSDRAYFGNDGFEFAKLKLESFVERN